MRLSAVVLAALALLALPSAASAWSVRTASLPPDAQLVDLGGDAATLYTYRSDGRSVLRLGVGRRKILVATSRGTLGEAVLGLDGEGAPTVSYLTVSSARGTRHAYVWRDGRTTRLDTGTRNTYGLDMSVAASGAAVIATASGDGLRTFRRDAGGRDFAAPQIVDRDGIFIPRTAIAPDGEAVAGWNDNARGIELVRAATGAAFGTPQLVADRRADLSALAITDAGRVLAGYRSTAGGERRSLLAQWVRGEAAPGVPTDLSGDGRRGSEVLVRTRGNDGYVAWRDTGADDRGARLGLATVGATGAVRSRRVLGAGDGTSTTPPAAIAPAGDGVRVYVAPMLGPVRARTLAPDLHVGAIERVSPSGEHAVTVRATTARGRAVAAWTGYLTKAYRDARVRIATPG